MVDSSSQWGRWVARPSWPVTAHWLLELADPLHPLWAFAVATGMRRSELLGLRWADVDFKRGTAAVSQIVIDGEDGYRLERDQKSVASGRTIHLSKRTVRMLTEHRELQAKEREIAGPAWKDHDLVFPRDDGTWYNPPAISLAFGRAVKRAGAPHIRLHDVRHTHATLLLAAGVNPKVVSERLGHSSVAFTLDTYAHVMPGMQPEAAELFDELIFRGSVPRRSRPHNITAATTGMQSDHAGGTTRRTAAGSTPSPDTSAGRSAPGRPSSSNCVHAASNELPTD
jgi:hypothetical protein